MNLGEFLSHEAGQKRRAWLDNLFAPIENAQGFDRIATIGDMLNPVSDIGRAGVSARTVFDPSATTNERIGATGAMLTDMASVLAPGVATDLAARAGGKTSGDAVRAITEALAGFSAPADDAVTRFAASQAGSVGADDVAKRGDEILALVKSDPTSVTDEMLDMGDPVLNARLNEYLFKNYDLPMDAQSRMARAGEMGMDTSQYHGTTRDYPAVKDGRTFYSTPDTEYAEVYTNPSASSMAQGADRFEDVQPSIMPVVLRSQDALDTTTPEGRRIFNDQFFMQYGNGTPLSDRGYPDWADAEDFGEMFADNGLPYRAVLADEGGVPMPDGSIKYRGVSTATFDPTAVRSRFARFDPRLAHLRNLSAGAAGTAMLGDYLTPDQRETELRAYLGM